ncbi:MAG: glycosyltransferase family 39 protein [Acidobacteria bacterium]|nr:glycosyltransferase family 39 protein [Acidobacteriota bacterium]
MNLRWEKGPMAVGRLDSSIPALDSLRGSRLWEALLLLAALAVFSMALGPALRESGTPPGWDQSVHLKDSLVSERLLLHPEWMSPAAIRAILHGSEDYPLITPSGYYPPLVPVATGLLYLSAGRSYETAMATNLIFLGLLLWGVWGLGNQLAGRPAGIVAALLVLAAPGIRLSAAEYMLDLPLTCMVILAVWACILTDGFSRRARSVLFGILCGLGMLTKWSFFLFLIAPTAMILVEGLRKARTGESPLRPRLANLGWALLCATLVAAPYYAPIFTVLLEKTWVHSGGAADGFTSPFTLESALFHLQAIPRKLLGWPLTLAVATGVLAAMRMRGDAGRSVRFLMIWAASLYAIFTFAIVNKQSRYLLPWLPVLLLVTALGLLDLWRRRREGILRLVGAISIILLAALGLRGSWYVPPSGDWKLSSLVGALERDLSSGRAPKGRAWKLGVIPDMRQVNGPTVGYYVSRQELPVTVVQLVNRMKSHVSMEVGLDPFGRGDFYETFEDYDYLVTKSGDNAVPPWEEVVPQMMSFFDSRREEFTEIATFQVPDGSRVGLYRRNER